MMSLRGPEKETYANNLKTDDPSAYDEADTQESPNSRTDTHIIEEAENERRGLHLPKINVQWGWALLVLLLFEVPSTVRCKPQQVNAFRSGD